MLVVRYLQYGLVIYVPSNSNVFTAFSLSSSFAAKWGPDYILCVKRGVFPIDVISSRYLL